MSGSFVDIVYLAAAVLFVLGIKGLTRPKTAVRGNLMSATGMLLAERFDMQAQDVIFVDTAGISEWNRVISQLLPSISVIGVANSIGTN